MLPHDQTEIIENFLLQGNQINRGWNLINHHLKFSCGLKRFNFQ